MNCVLVFTATQQLEILTHIQMPSDGETQRLAKLLSLRNREMRETQKSSLPIKDLKSIHKRQKVTESLMELDGLMVHNHTCFNMTIIFIIQFKNKKSLIMLINNIYIPHFWNPCLGIMRKTHL